MEPPTSWTLSVSAIVFYITSCHLSNSPSQKTKNSSHSVFFSTFVCTWPRLHGRIFRYEPWLLSENMYSLNCFTYAGTLNQLHFILLFVFHLISFFSFFISFLMEYACLLIFYWCLLLWRTVGLVACDDTETQYVIFISLRNRARSTHELPRTKPS